MKARNLLSAIAVVTFLSSPFVRAGVHVWSGAGGNKLWSNAANWSSGGVPSAAEASPVILEFPASATGATTNNVAGLQIDSIRLLGSGLLLRGTAGSAITLKGSAGTNIYSAGINYIDTSLPVVLQGTNRIVAPVLFTINSLVSGSGALEIEGTMSFDGSYANTFTGGTILKSGQLTLDRLFNGNGVVSIPGPLIIKGGRVVLSESENLSDAADVTVQTGGVLDLNGYNESIGSLTLSSGSVETDAGVLTVLGPISGQGFGGSIAGTLSLGGSTRNFDVGQLATLDVTASIINGSALSHPGLSKTGIGVLRLNGANSFSGAVTIFQGTVEVGHASGLGAAFLTGTSVESNAFLRVTSGITIASETLTLNGGSLYGQGIVTWAGPMILNADSHIRSLYAGNELRITGAISGPGGFTHAGMGRLNIGGTNANTFGGEARITEGDLWLTKLNSQTAIPGPLIVGSPANTNNENTVWIDRANQLADDAPLTLLNSAVMWLNNVTETIGPLTLDGAEMHTGTGTLTLNGNVTVQLSGELSKITGKVSIGSSPKTFNVAGSPLSPAFEIAAVVSGSAGAELRKTGQGEMCLSGANTYPGRTEVYNGVLIAKHNQALGLADNGGGNEHATVVFNGGTLALQNANMGGENLGLVGHGFDGMGTLHSRSGNNTCSGRIQVTTDATIRIDPLSSLIFDGYFYGDGGLKKLGQGPMVFGGSQTNSYTGATRVEEGTLFLNKPNSTKAISGTVYIGTDDGPPAAVRLMADYPFRSPANVTVHASGILEVNSYQAALGSLNGHGQVTLGSGMLNISGGNFSGVISGAGSINKYINSTFRLGGTNTYTGLTTVHGGSLVVDGALAASPLRVEPGARLEGGGYVGNAVLNNATLSPGGGPGLADSVFSISTLRFGSLIMTNGSTYRVETQEHPGGGWDRDSVEVAGLTRITGTALDLRLGCTGATNVAYLVLNLTGNDAIQGTFDGLGQSATFTVDGAQLQVDYFSGTGNDVVLRQSTLSTNNFEVTLNIQQLPDKTIQLSWPAFASNYEIQTCTNLAGGAWETINLFRMSDGVKMMAHHYPYSWDAQIRYFRLRQPGN